MKVVLKGIFCIEWEFNKSLVLDENTTYSVTAYLGPSDNEACELYTITVCNLAYVNQCIRNKGFFCGLWFLVIENPTKEKISQYFTEMLPKEDFETWDDAFQKLRLIGQSEYEDYKHF